MTSDIHIPAQARVSVLSAGAWGVVLAAHLVRQGHTVTAFDLPEVVEKLQETRGHPKLPGFEVPVGLQFTSDLKVALVDAQPDCVVFTTPGAYARGALEKSRATLDAADVPAFPWVICSKAIEEESLAIMTEVLSSTLGEARTQGLLAVLSGPSFAAEVGRGKPTTVCVASDNPQLRTAVQGLFMSEHFRVYTQDDVVGVELGGALKNVIAIAAGVCDGLELGDNARAALITRGLAEMIRLGVGMGARTETFAGLTGMGDLILTCAGQLSRNHQFGELLAQGRTRDEALEEIGMAVEGVRTVRSVKKLATRYNVEMPIAEEVYAAIYEGKKPAEAVAELMRREARPERDTQERDKRTV